jgi:hypothetical protein
MVNFLNSLRYFIFAPNLSIFDGIWITIVSIMMETTLWAAVLFIPFIIISAHMKHVVEEGDDYGI